MTSFSILWKKARIKNLSPKSVVYHALVHHGDRKELQEALVYRSIWIGPIIVKVWMNIILISLSSFYESQFLTIQFGFRSSKGCNDGIYVIKQLHEIV